MTTKEIAEAVGKDERSVQRWVRKASDKMSSVSDKMSSSTSTHPADYDLEETCAIIEAGMGANAAAIYRANAQTIAPAVVDNEYGLDREYKLAIAGLYKMLESHESRIAKVERDHEERKALAPPPSKSTRQELRQIIGKLASSKYDNDYRRAWADLYREVYYRCRINVTARARHDGVKGVDVLEREGLLETATSIAMELLS